MKKKCNQCQKLFQVKYKCEYLSRKFCSCLCEWNSKKGKKKPEISGNKNGRYKNGKMYREGYIFILSPNHPHKNNTGYVREHRLVMEKHIGRYLHPKEVVHHINEVRDDNRIENLFLFSNDRLHRSHHNKLRYQKV